MKKKKKNHQREGSREEMSALKYKYHGLYQIHFLPFFFDLSRLEYYFESRALKIVRQPREEATDRCSPDSV